MNTAWWVKPDDLDARQKGVIDLPLTESHLILGPPGSGKTNLLLLRASQMVLSGKPDVLILVFTRTLREFVASGGHQYAFSTDKIRTLSSWTFEFLRSQGITPAKDPKYEKQRELQLAQIQKVITDKKLAAIHDAIVLDEAQDYFPGEIEVFFKLGRVVFAAADSRQQIYVTGEAQEVALEVHFDKKNVYPLKHHYRNGHKICAVADELAKVWGGYDFLMPTSNYDEKKNPSTVEIHCCADLSSQVKKVIDLLTVQMKAYPDEQLGLLCPSRVVLKAVWQQLQPALGGVAVLQSAEEGYVQFEAGKPICVCTIHGAKGLEFRAVHIVDAEHINKSPLNRNIAYTAVTRAKTSLSILHTKPLPPYIESALNIARPPVQPAKLEQLFGGA